MTSSKFLSTPAPEPQNIFWKPPRTLETHSKNFWQNRFLSLKVKFLSLNALKAWKNTFLSKIQGTKIFHRLYLMTNHARGRKYRTKWKDLSIRFLIKQLFFEKSHFLHPHAQKTSQKLRKSFTFCLKKSKKIKIFIFRKMFPDSF